MDDLRELYQQLILDHNQNPKNFRSIDNATSIAHGHNPLCGDEITLYLYIDHNQIKDLSFQGSGCAISKASVSIMTTIIKGKTIKEAEEIFDQYHTMITTGKTNGNLGKLTVMTGVHKFPARVKCALLSWHTMNNTLQGNTELTTTE